MAPDRKHPPPKKPRRGKKGPRPLIPFDVFLAEAERLKTQAVRILQADGHHAPILLLFTRDLGMEVCGLRLTGARPMHEAVRAVVQARQAKAFVCISEAWMTRGQAASLAVPPSQSPEREQVLVVSAIHPEGKRMWCLPFAAEGGKVVFGTPLDSAAEGLPLGGGIPDALGDEGRP